MKCNHCWTNLDGRAIATTCGHIFCTEDAARILKSDSTCPLCDTVLSKSNMKAVNTNPGDDWVNMVMAGVPPDSIMKSAFKGVVFWIGQKDVEAQLTTNKAMHLKRKSEEMQSKYNEKLEQLHTAYKKASKKIQILESEKESLAKNNTELQEKYGEKSRQKRRLEEMYEALRGEFEQLKRGLQSGPQHGALVKRQPQFNFGTTEGFEDTRQRRGGGLFDAPGPQHNMRSTSPVMHHRKAGFQTTARSPATSPFKRSDQMFTTMDTPSKAPPGGMSGLFSPTKTKAAADLRNILLSPAKRPQSRFRAGGGLLSR